MSAKKNYKHKKITSFNRGMGQYIIEDDKKFLYSENLRTDTEEKISLSKDFDPMYSIDSIHRFSYQTCCNNDYSFLLGVDSDKKYRIYRSDDGESWEFVTTFTPYSTSGSNYEPDIFLTYNNYIIIIDFAKNLYYSANSGNSWTTVTNAHLPYLSFLTKYVEHNNRLYLCSHMGIIYLEQPSEGLQLLNHIDDAPFYGLDEIIDIFTLHNSLYIINQRTLYLIENGDFKKIGTLKKHAILAKFDDVVYFIMSLPTGGLLIYFYDGISIQFLKSFSPIYDIYLVPLIQTEEYFTFCYQLGTETTIFRLLKNGSLFIDHIREHEEYGIYVNSGHSYNGTDYYIEAKAETGYYDITLYQESFSLPAGILIQSMLVEPEMIPQGIILVTNPLPEGTSVKVYHSSNGGNTFSSVLINHNIENATSAKYSFPPGTKIDLSMIKLELLSTSGGSPIVHYIDYFYTPSGVSTL